MHKTIVISVQCIPDDRWKKRQTLILASSIDSSWKRAESSPSHFGQSMRQKIRMDYTLNRTSPQVMKNTGSKNGNFMTHAFIPYSAEESCINFHQLQIFISSKHIYMTKLRQKQKVKQCYLDKWHLVMLNDSPLLSQIQFNFLNLTRLLREMDIRVTICKPNGSSFH